MLERDHSNSSPGRSDAEIYYDALAWQLEQVEASASANIGSLGVVSCASGEGVTTTAYQLAMHWSQRRRREVILVDANRSGPLLQDRLGLDRGPDLNDALSCPEEVADFIRPTPWKNLSALTCNPMLTSARRSIDETVVARLLAAIQRQNATAILDLPAVDDTSECFAWAPLLDGVLLVIEAGRSPAQVVQQRQTQLLQAGVKLLGVVFNN